ncbi:MAG TPA: sortase [Anaerolineaceae bacterium]|nr:sortase [Anaerolineaceae bacterium]
MNNNRQKETVMKLHTWVVRFAAALLVCLLIGMVQPVQAQRPEPTTAAITSIAPNPAYINQPVAIQVSVAASDPLAGVPTGTVEIRSGQDRVCTITLDSAGHGMCALSFDTPATLPLKAFYLGSDEFVPDDSPEINLVVRNKHTPVVEIRSHLPNPSVIDGSVDVAVELSSDGPAPTGSITIWRSSAACTAPPAATATDRCATGLTAGAGSCSLTLSEPGEVFLCAAYGGDTFTFPAQAEPAGHFVSDSNTVTVITGIDPEPSVLGETVQVSFEVSSPDGVPAPTDLVRVTSGSLACTATVEAGRCALTFNTPHLHDVVATYQGGELQNPQMPTLTQLGLEPSTSPVVVHRVNAPPTNITLSADRVSTFSTVGSEIASLTAVDPNLDETHTFTLVGGAGSANNSLFRISGDRLLLNGEGADPGTRLSIRIRATDPAGLAFEKAFALRVSSDAVLPATGFAAGRVTDLLPQPAEKRYQQFDNVRLEIPALGVQADIAGVPHNANLWDTTWLWDQVGWLNGTAFPGWQGNSVLAAHNFVPSGNEGPFVDLHRLRWGDQVLVHAFGETHVYAVRSVEIVRPEQAEAMEHEDTPWLTLVTCKSFDEESGSYRWRVVVRAEWVAVQ